MALRFNVRVYGLCINPENQILLSKEHYKDFHFTKFPGGGMDYGEGTLEALKREFLEEIGIEPTIQSHFYTTDFFQKSVVDETQIISIYYLITVPDFSKIPQISDTGTLFFAAIDETLIEKLNLPIDKVVGKLLLKEIGTK